MNSGMAFVRIQKAQEMLAIGNNAHEIAIKFTSLAYAQDSTLPFWDTYSEHGNEALSWIELMSQLTVILEMTTYSKYIMGAILFGVVIFGSLTHFLCRYMNECLNLVYYALSARVLSGWRALSYLKQVP